MNIRPCVEAPLMQCSKRSVVFFHILTNFIGLQRLVEGIFGLSFSQGVSLGDFLLAAACSTENVTLCNTRF